MEVSFRLPEKLHSLFAMPRGAVRYRCAYGGRGSGKSFSFASMALIFGAIEPLRILCVREFQASLAESFFYELVNAIKTNEWLDDLYEVGAKFIRGRIGTAAEGTEFIFKGLRRINIKSLSQIDICIIEEADDVSERALRDLFPTIRKEKSEIWVIWNPCTKGSAVDKRFIQNQSHNCAIAKVNYTDNPFFTSTLENERIADLERLSQGDYAHVWEGDYLEQSHASVFYGKWEIKSFEADENKWDGPYFGLDFGFSQDPTAAVMAWVYDGCLWVEYECGGVGIENDEIASMLLTQMPRIAGNVVRADSAYPATISQIRRSGIANIIAAKKGVGSVEEGIKQIRAFRRVFIHPRCSNTLNEFKNYSYKVTSGGDVTSILIDSDNHWIDAIRYAIEPLKIKRDASMWG